MPKGAPFAFYRLNGIMGWMGELSEIKGKFPIKLRAIYEQITNNLRAKLLYLEKMREYDGCGADEI